MKKFHDKPEQDIEDWYELGKNDFASDLGTVSTSVILAFGVHVIYLVQAVNRIYTAQLDFERLVAFNTFMLCLHRCVKLTQPVPNVGLTDMHA